ncbi:two-component system, LytTR family, sensor histidine kinase AgrC [Enterococcus sp. DIV2402]|uniref:Two-component system, LytTR family, sensor histidine kinase AgrC n=1 Tax=Candidatus Enterococcus lowellii TaxID=2230877 RepID=A0ABZ2SJ98_9ENTE|nr:GHKL domain-containing protein [Enterococcus sp. DIV2402]MBO0465264.1 GHKL domain-containing protein [Enterococcus sp. DIV2402]
MFYLLVASSVIQIFCNFLILDKLPILKKYNLFLSSIILIISFNLSIYISQIDTLVLFVLLFSLSYMNNRTQMFGKILFHFAIAYFVVFSFNYLFTDIVIKIILSENSLLMFLWFCFTLTLNISLAFFIRRFLLSKLTNKLSLFGGYILFTLVFSYQLYKLSEYVQISPTDLKLDTLLRIFNIFIILLVISGIISIVMVKRHQKLALETQKKEIEYQSMQLYTAELNKQYQEIRKFRHDYINILSSMESYMELEQMSELKDYYHQHIQPTRAIFSEHFTKLNDLQKIEDPAIRSIFMTKLVLAQEKNISVQLEISELIQLPDSIDPVILVRIFGILLDNAIEELTILNKGELEIAIFKLEQDTIFIIQNTARVNIEPLHQLKTNGFSTKGNHRGIGLSTVDNLIKQVPNLLLETIIENQLFTQKLTILTDRYHKLPN